MRRLIAEDISDITHALEAQKEGAFLSKDDITALRTQGPVFLKKVQKNTADEKSTFKGLSDKDKRVLLAYIVYFRQNISSDEISNPNYEDAARILHQSAFKGDKKDTLKDMEEELKKQLIKAGIKIEKEK